MDMFEITKEDGIFVDTPIEFVMLQKKTWQLEQSLSDSAFSLDLVAEETANQMRMQLTAAVLCNEVDCGSIKVPLNWKESFKERWFPEWAKKRWPVKYMEFEAMAWMLYPFIERVIPKEETFVKIAVCERLPNGVRSSYV